MEEKMFQFADGRNQIKEVNCFLCISTAILYFLSYVVVTVSLLQGKRTPLFAISMLIVILITTITGFVLLKKNSSNERLRYIMMLGLCVVTAMLVYAYVDYYMRFLAVMPFVGCALFFDVKFSKISAILVSAENIIITLFREFVLHNYEDETFVPNLVAGIAVSVLMFLVVYVTNLGRKFNQDSLNKIQHEADLQNEMLNNVIRIAGRVQEGSNQAMDIVNDLQSSSESVNHAVGDISESSISTAESIQNQSLLTQNIQTNLDDMVLRTENMVKVAENSSRLNNESVRKIHLLRNEAETLISVNDTVAESMKHLQQNVENVKEITKTILDISSQTNLLSLNASIESARAGEAGRGFAVVADEIRTLSERTKQETENISQILDDLASNTIETAKAIDRSLKSGSAQEEMIIDISKHFEEMNSNVNMLSEEVNEIEKAVNLLSIANTEIVNDITTLSAVTEEVTASAQQSAEMTANNYKSTNDAKDILENILSVSHELDQYIK